jgi:chemotaxis protein CheX
MTSQATTLRLPEILDLKAAAPLRSDLLAARGGPIELDASHVQRLGGLCLQVLMSAQRSWATDGKALRVIDMSTDFADGLALFGVPSLNTEPSGVSL